MSYPLIILGAGASYDYSEHKQRPPMTNDLIKPEYLSAGFLEKYHEAAGLISEISARIKTSGNDISFEDVLQSIKGASDHTIRGRAQLLALQFYLQDLFHDISESSYHPINRYSALINHIDRSGGKACIISFNYDTLLEKSFVGNFPKNIDSYVNGDIKVIKLHGSHDWFYEADSSIGSSPRQHLDFLTKHPEYLDNLRKKDFPPTHLKQLGAPHRFPAIAIPLPEKQAFVCPSSHIRVLLQEMPVVDKILVIGWKAGDPALVELLKNYITQPVTAVIVSGSTEDSRKIRGRLEGINNITFSSEYVGFGAFMGSKECQTFFAS